MLLPARLLPLANHQRHHNNNTHSSSLLHQNDDEQRDGDDRYHQSRSGPLLRRLSASASPVPNNGPPPALIVDSARDTTVASSASPLDLRQRVRALSLPNPIAVAGRWDGYRSVVDAPIESPLGSNMAAIAEETPSSHIPDSPPGLSYEKSPKSSSSSLRSDSVDLSESTSTDKLGHYQNEDEVVSISDRESLDDSNLKPESRPTLKRPQPRTNSPVTMRKMSAPNALREAENRVPQPSGRVPNGVLRDQSLNLPGGRTLRRGFSSPSSPSLQQQHGGPPSASSRSPSPTKHFAASPTTTQSSGDEASPNSLPRRPSWQPSWQPRRKSVRELEAECNNDDDDGIVPEGAILENVPISPMPGGSRTPRLSSRSNTPSPQRRGSFQAHSGLHSANVPKNAKRPSAPPVLPNGQYGSPRSPRHGRPPMPLHANTISSSSPSEPLSRKHRSKSWTEDLNDEARHLSAALEEYADRQSTTQHGSGSVRPGVYGASNASPHHHSTLSLTTPPAVRPVIKPRSMTNIHELQINSKYPASITPTGANGSSINLDGLPPSKEKSAVLTRTRPSWLPPKSQREEKRHMKEWEAMMAASAEAERKRTIRARESAESHEELSHSLKRLWLTHVLPNWDTVINEPRTRELWWRGVTPAVRGAVWSKAIGNELGLTKGSFEAALKRAKDMEAKFEKCSAEEKEASKEWIWFQAIKRDVAAVFSGPGFGSATTSASASTPTRSFSASTSTLASVASGADTESSEDEASSGFAGVDRAKFETTLADVLMAYALYRSDVGYVYGVHRVAGMLVLHMLSASSTASAGETTSMESERPYHHNHDEKDEATVTTTSLDGNSDATIIADPAAQAFITLANALNRPLPMAFLTHDTAAMARTYALVLETLRYKFPRLHAHLNGLVTASNGLSCADFLDPMFRCLFIGLGGGSGASEHSSHQKDSSSSASSSSSSSSSKSAVLLPLAYAARIWDLWVFEGDKVLIRAAVAFLGACEGRLYGGADEVRKVLGWAAAGDSPSPSALSEKRRSLIAVLGSEEEFVSKIRDAGKVSSASSSTSATAGAVAVAASPTTSGSNAQ